MKFITTPYDGIETLEIPITSATKFKYHFPILERLDNKIIRRIDLIHSTSSEARTPSNRPLLNKSAFVHGYLSLQPQNNLTVNRLPLFYLLNIESYFNTAHEFLNYPVRFDKCFVEFAESVTLNTSQSVFVVIYYSEREKQKFFVSGGIKKLLKPLYKFWMGIERVIFQTYTVKVDNVNKTRFYFSLDEKLENAKIKKVEFVSRLIKTPGGKNTVRHKDIYSKSFITLVDITGREVVKNCPLSVLLKINNNLSKVLFNDIVIDWTKSYIDVANNTSLVANTEFLFNVYYTSR